MADAANAAGVLPRLHVGRRRGHEDGIPHFDSKYEVENHIATIGVPATIIAPVYFMENAIVRPRSAGKGVYATPLTPDRKLAQIAVADIAAFAVLALEQRDRFAGKRHDIAGDELSGNEAVAILSRVTGKPFSYFQVPMDMIRKRMGDDGAKMYEWFERVGYKIDLAALRATSPRSAGTRSKRGPRRRTGRAILGG